MKIYELRHDGEWAWIVAKSQANARTLFNSFAGNKIGDVAECRPLSDIELRSSYICDANESEPDEGDPDFPDYNPDEWINGMRIQVSLFEYLEDSQKPHVIELDY